MFTPIAMHDPLRPETARHNCISGVEVGFVRTIARVLEAAEKVRAKKGLDSMIPRPGNPAS
jgi:hypothetical protein